MLRTTSRQFVLGLHRCLKNPTGPVLSVSVRQSASRRRLYVSCSIFEDQPPKRKKQPYVKPPTRKPVVQRTADGTPQQLWLAKALAAAGVAARRKCETLIKEGRVKLNGRVVTELVTQVDPSKDKVQLDGQSVRLIAEPKHFYLALNKPKGYICSNVEPDQRGRRAVDLLKTWMKLRRQKDGAEPRLFTVGRLDVATQGLIFLTNDGAWAQSLMHPKHGITKEYEVVVPSPPSRPNIQRLLKGCVVDGRFVRPVRVSYLPQLSNGRGRLRVTVQDGRNREVRVLVDNAGMEVLQLTRVRIGGFCLPASLGPGEYMELQRADVSCVTDPEAQDLAGQQLNNAVELA